MRTEFADPSMESQPSRLNQSRNDEEEKCRGGERKGERDHEYALNLEVNTKH